MLRSTYVCKCIYSYYVLHIRTRTNINNEKNKLMFYTAKTNVCFVLEKRVITCSNATKRDLK